MNCLYTGMQWNKRSRSPKLVLEAILLQRMLVFEQFVSASKLAPEVLKERNRVWGFCLWHDWIIKFAWVPPRALPPFPPPPPPPASPPPPPPIRPFDIVMIPLPHRWQVNYEIAFLHFLPPPSIYALLATTDPSSVLFENRVIPPKPSPPRGKIMTE